MEDFDYNADEEKSNSLTFVRSLIVLGVVVVAVIAFLPNIQGVVESVVPVETVEIECVIGSEKSGFLDNQQVQNILAQDYGIEVSYRRAGSIEQVMGSPAGLDCLWPSNTSAYEIFADRNPDLDYSDEIIFNSPIVLYSWQPVVDALIAEGLVTENADGILTTDSFEILNLLVAEDRPSWSDLGVSSLFGNFNIVTTDPTRSNSGNMFYALLANILNEGDVATETTIEPHLATITAYYDRQGRLEDSSGFLFEQFTRLGVGSFPIIANYESLLIEFAIANPDNVAEITSQIRVIYLTPTVWSSHPLIALTDNGERFLEALRDQRLQTIAWEEHGFRSGLVGVENNPDVFNLSDISADVTSVIPLPRSDALLALLDALED